MTLNELRYIVALAQAEHFGRAAKACHVSQPTLSIAIKKLEEELGVMLFERSRSRVWPTPIGHEVIARAEQVLEGAEDIRQLTRAAKDPFSEPLKLGAIYSIGPYLFPHLVPQLARAAPELSLFIEENYTARLREKLRSGALDAVIIALPFTEPDVVTQPLYDEPFVVLMPSGHALAKKNVVQARDLEGEPLLLLGAGHCFRDQVLELLPSREASGLLGEDHSGTIEGSSLETLKYMVASGLGLTVLPLSAAGTGLAEASDSLVWRKLDEPGAHRTVALAWRTSYPRHGLMELLNQGIRGCQITERPTQA